jgi:hypothetical protein
MVSAAAAPSLMVNTGKQMLRRAISENEMTDEGETAEETLLELAINLSVLKALTAEDTEEWMNDDEQQEMTKDVIINLVRKQKEESEEEEDEVCTEVVKNVTHGRSKCYRDSSEVC